MRLPLPELLLAAVLAAGFAAVGELVLRRRIRDIAGANEAMLVGMGLCAAALFPLSLAIPRLALVAEAVGILGALAVALGTRLLVRRPGPPARPAADPVARLALGATALVAAGFAALNFRYTYLWDGMLIWATKAQLLFHSGGLTREWFVGDVYDLRHLAYPPLIPLYESLLSLLRGGFDVDRLKPVFLVFYVSMLVGTYSSVRALLSARLASAATLLVSLLPALSTQFAAGGYADMPEAAAVAGVTAAAMGRRRNALPWLLGTLTTVKAEGAILAALAGAGILLFWVLESGRWWLRRVRADAAGIAIVAAFFALRIAYVRWIDAPIEVYGGSLSSALARVPVVLRLCLEQLADPRVWGFFWAAFLLAALAALAGGSNLARSLAATVAVSLVLLTVPFLVTTWPLEVHIAQAYFRLAAQIAPAAAAVIALGYAAASARLTRTPVLG